MALLIVVISKMCKLIIIFLFIQPSYVVYLKEMNNELFLTEAQYLILYFKPNTLHVLLHLEPIICIQYSVFVA